MNDDSETSIENFEIECIENDQNLITHANFKIKNIKESQNSNIDKQIREISTDSEIQISINKEGRVVDDFEIEYDDRNLINNHEMNDKTSKCEIYEKEFKTKTLLKNHFSTVHYYKCEGG